MRLHKCIIVIPKRDCNHQQPKKCSPVGHAVFPA